MLLNKVNDILNTTYTNDIHHVICKYIKDHVNEIPNMSIDQIAEECFVSKSMVSKFTKKLGYESFKDFKYECQIYANVLSDQQYIMPYESGDLRTHMIETMDCTMEALRNAVNQIDYKKLSELIEDIRGCKQIIAMGHGVSKNICESLQFHFDYIEKPVIISDTDFNRETLMEEDTLVLVISVNGNLLKHKNKLIKRITKLEQKKWFITCNNEYEQINNTIVVPSKDEAINDALILFLIKVIANHINHKKSKVYKT